MREEPTRPAPLRVGILVDSLVLPAWVHRALADVRASSAADLVLVVRNGAFREPALPELVRDYRQQLLPLLYDRLDARLVRRWRRPDAFARSSIAALVAGLPTVEVRTVRRRYSDYFPDEDVERILAHDLDVALRFGFRILRGRALAIARYGVWSYHHGDNLEIRGGPNSFWEVMEARPVTGAVLQVLTSDLDNGKVIYRSHSATNPLSLSLSRNAHYWKAAAFVGRKLRELHERGPVALEEAQPADYRAYDDRLHRRPTNLEAVPILARFGARLVGRAAERALTRERWFVAYAFGNGPAEGGHAFYKFKRLAAPAGASWSEPFPILIGGRHYLFVTDRPARIARSRIVLLEVNEQGLVGQPRVVLEAGHDFSYPHVFEWRGELYLLPQAGEACQVVPYRCAAFPDRWERQPALLEGVRAAHATLAEVDGCWWMFATIAEPGASTADELHLFSADSPLGPWRPHPRNPVKSDARSARPAGRPFEWKGRLYRPAQDCSRRSPYAISINRIDDLSRASYREVEVSRVRPRWRAGLVANGVMNLTEHLTCIDGQLRVPVALDGRRAPPLWHQHCPRVQAPKPRYS